MLGRLRRHGVAAGLTLAATVSLVLAGSAYARTNHALIVAVTEYPDLPPGSNLVGPNNDAAMLRTYLRDEAPVDFDDANVTVLADGLEGATSPTLAAIRQALAALAEKAGGGDFVYLHFGGHGSQQPAVDTSKEADGKDEIFLPRDTGLWTDRTKGVPNALVDDEIGAALDAIRAKGAFVWAVFDSCHSGTMTRAVLGGEEIATRKLDPSKLGIPDDLMEAEPATRSGSLPARENALGLGGAEDGGGPKGGLVAFFAAQTVEETPEMKLPRGAEDAEKLGLFSFTLLSKLTENPNISYRQLAQGILQAYSAQNLTRPTPLFEGELDAPVFGTAGQDIVLQWRLDAKAGKLSVPAGRLHRLNVGSKLAVLSGPGAALEDAVAYVEVHSAQNQKSDVVPVAYDGKPAVAVADLPANAYAQPVEIAVDFALKVAAAPETGAHAEAAKALNASVMAIDEAKVKPVNIQLVGADTNADLRLAVMSEAEAAALAGTGGSAGMSSAEPAVWLLPPTGEISLEPGRRPPSLKPGDDDALAEALVKIFRATSLSRLATASDYRPDEVVVTFRIKRLDDGGMEDIAAGAVPVVQPDDEVHMFAKNASRRPVDVNVLYVGSDYSVGFMHNERLHPGSEITVPIIGITPESFGIERMVAVLTEAQPQSPVEDLSFLGQVGLRQATRAAGGQQDFSGLLRDIGMAPATRGGMRLGDKAGGKGAVMIYPMENVPR